MNSAAEKEDWLASLKVGDEVAISYPFRCALARVAHTTANYVDVHGLRFSRKTGYSTGGGGGDRYMRPHLTQPTAAIRDEIERRGLRRTLEYTKWENYSLDKLRAVVAALNVKDQTP